jgi:hypothetical protein
VPHFIGITVGKTYAKHAVVSPTVGVVVVGVGGGGGVNCLRLNRR